MRLERVAAAVEITRSLDLDQESPIFAR